MPGSTEEIILMRTVKLSRRQCLGTVGVVLTALAAAPAAAQTFPTHPLRLIVPFAAGGSNDVMARLIAPHLEQSLGQPVIVDNRPAAAGQVGTEAVAKAPPDGHTLLLVASSHTVMPALNPKLPYNTEKDFAPISLINTNTMVFLVHPGVAANTLTEFVALANKEPGKFNYASPGVGSQTHLTIELLSRRTGIKLVHIPYRGGAPATLALMSGESQFTMLAPNVLFPHIESGRLRAIATGSPARHPRLPTVPTTAELGMPNLKAIQWVGVFTTAGTPKAIVDRLNAELNRIIRLPDVAAALEQQGVTPAGSTSEEFKQLISTEIAQWSEVVREANIQPE
jgi:tripartite-type tricarboxylate transporter receptor subunit TctC